MFSLKATVATELVAIRPHTIILISKNGEPIEGRRSPWPPRPSSLHYIDRSVLMIHPNGDQQYGHWRDREEEKERKGGRSIGRSSGELPRGEEYARPTSAPYCPPPTPALSWEGSDGLFITLPATTTWTPWLLIRARHCSELRGCACMCVCVCVCSERGGGLALYSSQVFINAANIECRWTLDLIIRERQEKRRERYG